jgi:hypothetical protein
LNKLFAFTDWEVAFLAQGCVTVAQDIARRTS